VESEGSTSATYRRGRPFSGKRATEWLQLPEAIRLQFALAGVEGKRVAVNAGAQVRRNIDGIMMMEVEQTHPIRIHSATEGISWMARE